jgi:hypothetical protein
LQPDKERFGSKSKSLFKISFYLPFGFPIFY